MERLRFLSKNARDLWKSIHMNIKLNSNKGPPFPDAMARLEFMIAASVTTAMLLSEQAVVDCH